MIWDQNQVTEYLEKIASWSIVLKGFFGLVSYQTFIKIP